MDFALVIVAILALSGFVKGLTGFGEAVIGVGLLSIVLSPQEAVVLMIIPIMFSNISLVRELGFETVKSLMDSYLILVSSVFAGTLVGMFFLEVVPSGVLSVIIGVILILYSLIKFRNVDIQQFYDSRFPEKIKKPLKGLMGFSGGFIFGSTSIGALIVIYLEYLDLSREKFVGFLGFVFLLISSVRVGFSYTLGYYSGSDMLFMSLLASIPVVIGVKAGSLIGRKRSNELHEKLVLILFALIGLRLITG